MLAPYCSVSYTILRTLCHTAGLCSSHFYSPFVKGGMGGFRGGDRRQIPPRPPLPKGGTEPIHQKLNNPGNTVRGSRGLAEPKRIYNYLLWALLLVPRDY